MKAEQYIKEHTNDDSNMIGGYNDNGEPQVLYTPWITKNDALYAIKLAKEEIMEKSIPAYIETNKYGNKQLLSWSGLCELDEFNDGDEVKIIILK